MVYKNSVNFPFAQNKCLWQQGFFASTGSGPLSRHEGGLQMAAPLETLLQSQSIFFQAAMPLPSNGNSEPVCAV